MSSWSLRRWVFKADDSIVTIQAWRIGLSYVCYSPPSRVEAMSHSFLKKLADDAEALKEQGLFKSERVIVSPQQAEIRVQAANDSRSVINMCANNYLGLASHPALIKAAH